MSGYMLHSNMRCFLSELMLYTIKALATKMHLNFDNKTSKVLSKCNHLSERYLGETHFVHKSRAVTRLKNKEKQNVIG